MFDLAVNALVENIEKTIGVCGDGLTAKTLEI